MQGARLRLVFMLGGLAYLILIWLHRNSPFFWDTIQFAGKHGLWYYENGLSSGFLPPQLNSGHPPTFGIYQAAVWTIFAKSLATSHFSMLPFLWLNLYYSLKIGELILQQQGWLFALALAVCPFYLGHSILVSPDLILVTGFLMTLYGCLKYQKLTIILGCIILGLISIRGQMMIAVIGLYFVAKDWRGLDKIILKLRAAIPLFGPGVAMGLGFHLIQSLTTDWAGLSASPWAESFEYVGISGWFRQLGIFAWRVADFGMVVPLLLVSVGFKYLLKDKHRLLLLTLLIALVLVIVLTPRVGLMNHRYFLPLQIVILLMATQSIQLHWTKGLSGKGLALLMLTSMLLGNWLIYPDKVAQGWDSTAAHWPIYALEQEMHDYIEDQQIGAVGTAFPYRSPRHFSNLESKTRSYTQYDMSGDQYILYGNVMNEFSDEEIETLQTSYQCVKRLEQGGLHLSLYKKGK